MEVVRREHAGEILACNQANHRETSNYFRPASKPVQFVKGSIVCPDYLHSRADTF